MTDVSEALRVRREVSKQAGVRARKRKIPLKREPKAGQLQYQMMLTDMIRTLEAYLKEEVIPMLPALVAEADADRGGVRKDSAVETMLRLFADMQLVFATAHPPPQREIVITGVGEKVDRQNNVDHQRQMKAALGIELIVPEPFIQSSMRNFIADNQALVKTLFNDQIAAFQTITSKGLRSGLRVESIQEELLQKLDITKSRAALLARDQTLKLAGELTQLRQENVGIASYVWNTSGDDRVRDRHAALDGTVQKWSDPPIVDLRTGRRAHPGGDYQCRCQAIPVIPEQYL